MKRQNFESKKAARPWWIYPVVTLVGASLLLGACGEKEDGPEDELASAQYRLLPATSCEDIRGRYIDVAAEDILKYRYGQDGRFVGMPGADVDFDESAPPSE